jgi:hypothetical protein
VSLRSLNNLATHDNLSNISSFSDTTRKVRLY